MNSNVVSLQDHAAARARAESPGGGELDLVGRLFDRIGEDPGIPAAVRAELARLRIPTLRAAQLEHGFVANRLHPARHLLDELASAAVGLDDAVKPEDATVGAIRLAVHELLTGFEESLAPFDAMAARIASFTHGRTTSQDEAARPVIREIERRERDAASRRVAEEEVARRLRARLWVPSPVRAVLMGPWVAALERALRGEGEGSPAWRSLVNTMDDLLWSVEPKASAEGRRRLAAIVPALVHALGEGLRSAEMPEAERDAFLGQLVDFHAHAVKTGLRGISALPDAVAFDPTEAPSLARTTFTIGEQRVEEIRLAGADECAVQAGACGINGRVRVGAWVELDRGARVRARKRLSWMSPTTNACLLVGLAPGATAISITPAALAEQVRRGEARIVEDAPLVERTLAAILAEFGASWPA